MPERDDAALLVAAARGDERAFETFYRRHLAAVTGFHLRRTGRRELAFDLTAETFAAVVVALDRYDPDRAQRHDVAVRDRRAQADRRAAARARRGRRAPPPAPRADRAARRGPRARRGAGVPGRRATPRTTPRRPAGRSARRAAGARRRRAPLRRDRREPGDLRSRHPPTRPPRPAPPSRRTGAHRMTAHDQLLQQLRESVGERRASAARAAPAPRLPRRRPRARARRGARRRRGRDRRRRAGWCPSRDRAPREQDHHLPPGRLRRDEGGRADAGLPPAARAHRRRRDPRARRAAVRRADRPGRAEARAPGRPLRPVHRGLRAALQAAGQDHHHALGHARPGLRRLRGPGRVRGRARSRSCTATTRTPAAACARRPRRSCAGRPTSSPARRRCGCMTRFPGANAMTGGSVPARRPRR